MQDTPKGLRKHIVLLGRRNAGKSRLFNALAGQEAAIVSSTPGSTTDPVEKTLELSPLGPVVLVDTAGLDDQGGLGQKRVSRSLEMLDRADMAILVTEGGAWGETEKRIAQELLALKLPFLVARNKMELGLPPEEQWRSIANLPPDVPCADVSAKKGEGLEGIAGLLAILAGEAACPPLLSDLAPAGGLVLLVAPIDSGAPKGRLILPQVQAIRDALDGGRICMVTTPEQLDDAMRRASPDIVICDSQAARETAERTPRSIPFTTFSILMARLKGDLNAFARGAGALARLRPGDAVLIQEACSHHAQKDDIGRVKIPALLGKMAGGPLNVHFAQGKNSVPYDASLKAIVHCGACMLTPRQMQVRQERALAAGIPMTNYGMAISLCQGVIDRALGVFPDALAVFRQSAAQD